MGEDACTESVPCDHTYTPPIIHTHTHPTNPHTHTPEAKARMDPTTKKPKCQRGQNKIMAMAEAKMPSKTKAADTWRLTFTVNTNNNN